MPPLFSYDEYVDMLLIYGEIGKETKLLLIIYTEIDFLIEERQVVILLHMWKGN